MSAFAQPEAIVDVVAAPPGWLRRGAFKYWTTWVGIALWVLLIGIAVLGPQLAPHGVGEIVGLPFQRPTAAFPLGTDFVGRDVLSRFLDGGQLLLVQSVASAVLAVGIGSTIGLAMAYTGGALETSVMRITDAFISIPGIVLTLLLIASAGTGPVAITLIVAIVQVPSISRFVRGIGLEVVQRDFVFAARARGENILYVVRKELFPNVLTPISIDLAFRISWAGLIIASLAFLGFGANPPRSDWGVMINENRLGLVTQPWSMVVPALGIAMLTLSSALIGDGITRAARRGGGER